MGNNYNEFIEDFKNYIYAIKNLSELYVNSMVCTIKQFLDFINTYKFDDKYNNAEEITLNEIRTLTNNDIYSYIFYLAENHYKQDSRNTKIEHLRAFFEFLFKIKHNIFKQPFQLVKTEKRVSSHLPNYLSLNEAQRVIQVYSESKKTREIRNNAIINLCLNCGLRVSEVCSLDISDFNFESNTFLIKGKDNKERMGYLNETAKKAVLKYIDVRKNIIPKKRKDENALFLSNKLVRITTSAIRKSIKKTYNKVNIDNKTYSVHTLRHTCATLLYKSGTDIKTIQEILGHSQVNTTKIYTHLHDEEVMKSMQEHPLGNFKMADALAY